MSDRYNDSECYVNRKALAFRGVLFSILVVIALYFGFLHRFVYIFQYRDYGQADGIIRAVDYQEKDLGGDIYS